MIVHLLQRRQALLLVVLVRLVQAFVIVGQVLGQVNQMISAELRLGIDDRRHLDHRGQRHPGVGDVGDVVLADRLLQQHRSTDDTQVANVFEFRFFIVAQALRTSARSTATRSS